MNTAFEYLYRDASNYKQYGCVVFAGHVTDALRERFAAALDGGEFFIAEQLRIPEVFPETWPTYADDHCWHESAGFEATEASTSDPFNRSVDQFVREAEEAAHHGWLDFDPQERRRGILGTVGNMKSRKASQQAAPGIVHTDPEIMSGEPVFVGTRVPVKNLFDCLEAGETLSEFLDDFPSVTREQAVAALEIAKKAVESVARSGR